MHKIAIIFLQFIIFLFLTTVNFAFKSKSAVVDNVDKSVDN